MKLYCGFKLDDTITTMVKHAMKRAEVEWPLVLVDEDRLHVTTAFLGDMLLQDAKNILQSARHVRPFYCRVGAADSFPGVLYLGVQSLGAHAVRDLQFDAYRQLTGKALWPLPYKPHLTLAKAVGSKASAQEPLTRAANRIQDLAAGSCLVQQLILFEKSEHLHTITLQETK